MLLHKWTSEYFQEVANSITLFENIYLIFSKQTNKLFCWRGGR